MNDYTQSSIPGQPDNVNSDASIIQMLNRLMGEFDLSIRPTETGWELYATDLGRETAIDFYLGRSDAYRAAIDCIIEACIDAWEQGGAE